MLVIFKPQLPIFDCWYVATFSEQILCFNESISEKKLTQFLRETKLNMTSFCLFECRLIIYVQLFTDSEKEYSDYGK